MALNYRGPFMPVVNASSDAGIPDVRVLVRLRALRCTIHLQNKIYGAVEGFA